MKATILLALLALTLSIVSSAYSIQVSYPKEVLIGQPFTVKFSLVTEEINSTEFQYITPGMEIINVSGMTAYKGFGGYWMVDKVNVTNSSELIVSFYGKIMGQSNIGSGIVLYGSTLNLEKDDNSQNSYNVLVCWGGTLWLNRLKGWFPTISTLPTFTSGYYKVIFKNINESVYVYSISVNSSTFLIKYDTGIPWNNITYIGIRIYNSTILPIDFSVETIPGSINVYYNVYYIVYLNGKEYASGYTNNEGYSAISLKLYGPATLNITFPQYRIYKVITISPTSNADIHETFPTLQISLLIIAIVILAISAWREMKGKRA